MTKKITQFLKFQPILKQKIWGGEKLMKQFHKESNKQNIGESWEISDIDDDISVVVNGDLKGESLKDLIEKYKGELVGNKVYTNFGDKFPLLIKFIDAKDVLSLQVHPNDEIAKKRHNCLGKTEMWYVLNVDKGGDIIVGFSEETDKNTFLELLSQGKELQVLNRDKVKKGDTYLIPAGRIHAIGKGVLLAEIQETSDITYRVSDWNRKDDKGNFRETHLDLALDAIDYSAKSSYKSEYFKKKNIPTNIVDCKYFTTNFLQITSKLSVNHIDKDSFIIYMCVEGKVVFASDFDSQELNMGETILVPSSFKKFDIIPQIKSELLEVYIK